MFGLGNGNKDDERFWNLMLWNIYATDKECEKIMPYVFAIVIVFVILLLVLNYC